MVFTCGPYYQEFLIDPCIMCGLQNPVENVAVLRWDVISVHLLLFESFSFKFVLVLFLERKWKLFGVCVVLFVWVF